MSKPNIEDNCEGCGHHARIHPCTTKKGKLVWLCKDCKKERKELEVQNG